VVPTTVPTGPPDAGKTMALALWAAAVAWPVSQLLSTAEVASEMYISTNTVKSHLKSVFRKLGAAHRGEAVRRARQLELI
jgi:LuxR family transcriptional regulator, maltose regulon positive regulatory protein